MGRGLVERRMSRRFQTDMLLEGVVVGCAAGLLIALYRLALHEAETLLRLALEAARSSVLVLGGVLLALALICLVVSILMRWEPFAQGSGVPQVDAEVMGRLDMPWHRVILGKFAGGTLCALAGLSLGREGPSVQLGAMAAKGISKGLGRGRGEERLLVTCGAAAGMSAAFNAPLTGVLFSLEEIHREFSAPLVVSAMAASVSSAFLAGQILGVQPALNLSFVGRLPGQDYLMVLLLGVGCGVLGALHNKGMFAASERVFGAITRFLPLSRYAVAFGFTALAALFAPRLLCGGDAIVELLQEPQQASLALLLMVLAGKYLLTTICFASGAPGGTLFPLCVLGMLCGAAYGSLLVEAGLLSPHYIANFVVLGIGGMFASVVRAPVTAVVLAFELTGSLDALLSVTLVAMVSYVVANTLKVDPFYEHMLARLVEHASSGGGAPSHEKSLASYVVGAGSSIDGRMVSDIDWPEGCRVLSVVRAGQELLVTGDLRLMALDELLVMMREASADESSTALERMSEASLAEEGKPQGRAHLR